MSIDYHALSMAGLGLLGLGMAAMILRYWLAPILLGERTSPEFAEDPSERISGDW